jgi:hypothetical protein
MENTHGDPISLLMETKVTVMKMEKILIKGHTTIITLMLNTGN